MKIISIIFLFTYTHAHIYTYIYVFTHILYTFIYIYIGSAVVVWVETFVSAHEVRDSILEDSQ